MIKEKQPWLTTRELAYLALMVAACTVGRLMFQFIPNVQPMTAILLIVTLQLGVKRGLIVSLLSLLITNLYFGMGIWMISQLLSFSLIVILMALCAQVTFFRRHLWVQVIFSIAAGFIYGFVIAIIDCYIYQMPHFWVYYFNGLWFDCLHAMGNGCFYVLLAPTLNELLKNFLK